jgi:putative transposase
MSRHETTPEEPGVHAMKRSKFTDERIAFALKQAEVGISVEEVCRKMGVSSATFYKWC